MFNANKAFGSYHSMVSRVARETIRQSQMLNDGTIPDRIFKKIRWYMVEAVIMGEMLATLSDQSVKRKDKESLIYLGAIMALFDVIVDDFRLDRNKTDELLDHTFSLTGITLTSNITAIEKVYYLYLDKLLNTIEKEHWHEISEHLGMIRMQMKSEEQYSKNITEESVTSITFGKGGVSALIFSAFLQQKGDSFRNAVYELGAFIQMMNDCQDIHKDTVDGIRTFVHFKNNFGEIAVRLDEQRRKCFAQIKSLDYPHKGRNEILFSLNAMFVVITYKLHRYARICGYRLDFRCIAAKDKTFFRTDPFSPASVSACFPKILRFDFESCESASDLNFEYADQDLR
jgi:hypothetical protein